MTQTYNRERLDELVRNASFLVTGGAGFIGSHLVEALIRRGASRVTAIDNLRAGDWQRVPNDSRVEKLTLDISELSSEELAQLLGGRDFVFHLAAEKHNQSRSTPERVLEVNVNAAFRLFQACAAARVRKVVFTSSLYALGRLTLPPMRESDLPEPRTVYGVSKLAGELLLSHFRVAENLRSSALRLFFVYGPRQLAGGGYKSVIVRNFERILRGERPVIFGDGEQALDYTHVDDVVRALLLALDGKGDGETIHIGSGSAVTVNALTGLMLDIARSSLRPKYEAADETAGWHRVADNRKAQQLLGWTPSIPMPEGLQTVYQWMKGIS